MDPAKQDACYHSNLLHPWWDCLFAAHLVYLLTIELALLCSISHFTLFSKLHGTTTEGDSMRIRQSYVTSISLLLVTIFKSTLLGSVGLSFAQHLWNILRQRAVPVSVIDTMFSMRSNPFELLNFRTIRPAPVLFFTAVYMWLVPLAVIYPPGALTVTSQLHQFIETVEVPTFNTPRGINDSMGRLTDLFALEYMYNPHPNNTTSYATYRSVPLVYLVERTLTLLDGGIFHILVLRRVFLLYQLKSSPGPKLSTHSHRVVLTHLIPSSLLHPNCYAKSKRWTRLITTEVTIVT
jgi:hypothetical protein